MTLRMFENFRPVHELLHRLWTSAVGTDEYVKADWLELERAIDRLAIEGLGDPL